MISTADREVRHDGDQVAEWRAAREEHLWAATVGDLPLTQEPRIVIDGSGPWVHDADGRTWFDCLSGFGPASLGHGRPEIADAVSAQIRHLNSSPGGTVSLTTIRLAERVSSLAPDPRSKVLFTNGGSEAVEAAIRIALTYHRNLGDPGRHKIVSRHGSRHGSTLGCIGLGGPAPDASSDFRPPLAGMVHVQGPDEYRHAGTEYDADLEHALEIERAILREGPETVAAVIGEPISLSAGVHIPDAVYWPRVRQICDRYGVLLILDEINTSFGRTGTMFASQHWDVDPDITIAANGLNCGYGSIAAVIVRPEIAHAFGGAAPLDLGVDFDGNPVACAAGLASLDIIEREGLVENSRVMGSHLYDLAQELYRYRIVGQVRGGFGLMCAVELVRDLETCEPFAQDLKLGQQSQILMEKQGLLGQGGNVLVLAPPLSVSADEVHILLERMDTVIGALDAQLGDVA